MNALVLDPNIPEVHVNLALMYGQLGVAEDAVQHMQSEAKHSLVSVQLGRGYLHPLACDCEGTIFVQLYSYCCSTHYIEDLHGPIVSQKKSGVGWADLHV